MPTITVSVDGSSQAVDVTVAPATDPTFGTTTVGGTTAAFLSNVKRVNMYALPQAGAVAKLSIYLQPNATGTADIKGVLYADSNGAPGALVAVSNELAFSSTMAAGWYDLPFASPVDLAAGTYWIGLVSGGTASVAGYAYAAVTNSRQYNNNAYASGPSNPFGTGVTDNQQMSLYATYTASDPPPPAAPVNTTAPAVTGTLQVGDVLTASEGTWENDPTSFSFQWQRDANDISGATTDTYTIQAADEGDTLQVVVTATNPAGSASATSAATGQVPTPSPPSNAPVFYAPTSIWNQQLAADAARDPNESTIVSSLISQFNNNPNGISCTESGVPIYTVGPDQPKVKVTVSAPKDFQNFCNAVPLPDDAKPSLGGTDQRLVVYQPLPNDEIWEFWRLAGGPGNWSASGGGHMYYQSQDPGYFRNVQSPSGDQLELPNWGGVACSLGMPGGCLLIAECQAGAINHALCIALKSPRSGVWAAPCQRTDGSSSSSSMPPEGAHFRLDPTLDVSSLGLTRFQQMLALAIQNRGLIVNNTTGDGQALRGEDPGQYIAAHGYNPWTGGPNPIFGGQTPAQILSPSTFPWQHLQLLKMDLRTTADNTLYTQSPP